MCEYDAQMGGPVSRPRKDKMTALINTNDSEWGQDGAIFESRQEAIECMTKMARDFGLKTPAAIEDYVDSTLREVVIETASEDELSDVESEIKMLGCSPEMRAAVQARRAQLEAE